MAADGKRRLPVIQSGGDEEPERPPLHWVGIAGVATLIGWLPLSLLAGWIGRRAVEDKLPTIADGAGPMAIAEAYQALTPGQRFQISATVVSSQLVALAIAGLLAGLLVGRFGGAAGKQEATVGGAAAAAVASLVSALSGGLAGGPFYWLMSSAVVMALAAVSARGGAMLGRRLRDRPTR